MSKATIAVDAMGGDEAPEPIVQGALEALARSESKVVLVGDEARIKPLVDAANVESSHRARLEIVHASQVIPMDAKPKAALTEMPDASLPVAARLVAEEGGPDALVSAGNTGAVVLACSQAFERIPNVRRTALAAVIPTQRRHGPKDDPFSLLLDAGATLRVGAKDLAIFGLMGASYAAIVSSNAKPRVALLSNGSEPNKGTPEIVEAHAFLHRCPGVEFIGNIEGVDLPQGKADVIICDGFTGNITLKMLEGVYETVMNLARFAYRSKITWKMAMVLLGGGIRRLKAVTDWQQYGGAPILGFNRLCIKAHGRSGHRAIRNAIRVAERCVAQDLTGRISSGVAALSDEVFEDA